MPSSLIEVRQSYTPDEELALVDAVHEGLVAAFKIPQEDHYIRLLAYEPNRMVNGLKAGRPDHYTRVTIDCFPVAPSRPSVTCTARSCSALKRSEFLAVKSLSFCGRVHRKLGLGRPGCE